MAIIAIPAILREKFGDAVAQAFLELFSQVEKETKDRTIESVEDRFEIRLSTLDERFDAKLSALGDRFERRLAETKAELIKWMFIFWVGQFASIVGVLTAILFAFFKR